jgi:hypothetical protein
MKRKTAVTGLLFMGVLVAAATLGLVYGNWAERINLNGTVQTGNLDVSLNQVNGVTETEAKGKDIGTCDVQIGPEVDKFNKVRVTIGNGYPGYSCKFWINLTNTGTLPVELSSAVKNLPAGITVTPVPDGFYPEHGIQKGDCQGVDIDADGVPAATANQLNPGDTVFCDWRVSVTKAALQETTYEFSINILAELLNKPAA